MYRLCSNCKRKNCTMTNTGDCPMWTDSEIMYDGQLYIFPKSRRERRLEERLKKKKYANHK